MTERRFEPIDADAVGAQLDEASEQELAIVETKLAEARSKRNLAKPAPDDLSRMTDVEFQNYRIKKYGF